tara:strand:+ start:680 stop:1813 length:1134 start_codon:yes stop_codon:yes gene_type:complete
MLLMVERILTSNFKKLNSGENLQHDSFNILQQEVVQKNIDIFKKLFESLENYDSQYWSIYYSDNKKLINIDIGEYKIVEIGTGYFAMIVDITLFNTNDYKFLLNNLSDEQKSIFENDFSDDFVNLYITSEISNKEFEILTAAQNIALSKVFGDTYNTPKIQDNEELLNYFSISKSTNQDEKIDFVDDKFIKLLSGESSTTEYKETMFDEPNQGSKISGHIMFDEVIRCIAGMANSTTGGSLLVGAHDIELDELTGLHTIKDEFYKIVNKQFKSEDDFLLKLSDALKKVFDLSFIVTLSIDFLEIEQKYGKKKFLHIFIPAYTQPVFVKFQSELNPLGTKSELFFVRSINSTENLSIKETIEYLTFRFPNFIQSITSK